MKKKIIVLIIISLFFTLGCSYKEINDLAIVSAIGIDYKDNNYVVSVQVMNLQKETNDATTESSILYSASGKTILEALKNIHLKYPNTLYLGHSELLIIGQSIILNNNINKIFDFFLREPQARTDCLVIVSDKNDAIDLINPKDENNEGTFPSKDLITIIENSKEITGYTITQTLEEFIINYYEEGLDTVLTNVVIDNSDNQIKTKLTGLVAFKNNNYVGRLSENNSFIYNTINNNYKRGSIDIPYKNNLLGLELKPNSKINVSIKDNKIIYDINVTLEGVVTELHTNIDFNTDKDYKKLEDATNEYIKEEIKSLIDYCKSNNVDILGLKNLLYKYKYKEYKKYKDSDIYNISKININVDSNIYRYGNISRGDNYES